MNEANSSVFEVSPQTFQTDVIDRSKQMPVLLLFWAAQVGPSAQTRDVLTRLAAQFQGKVMVGLVDVARDRSLHHPEAWVAIAGRDSAGVPRVRVMSLAEYHGDNRPRTQGFFEWETGRTVQASGAMTHVWSSYASARTPGGEPYDRGVNSITLFHDGSRWWIMGWMFDSAAE